ncbi:MAG: hypothetical protein K940chlam9_00542 [Chlamydiae bacterium]|nr:hypothetical protein [Chlamydiota bacterium]
MNMRGISGLATLVMVGGGLLLAGIGAQNLPSLLAGGAILSCPLSVLANKVAMYVKPRMQRLFCPKTAI